MSRGTLRVRVLDALNLISGDSLTGSLSVIDICQMYVLIYYFFFSQVLLTLILRFASGTQKAQRKLVLSIAVLRQDGTKVLRLDFRWMALVCCPNCAIFPHLLASDPVTFEVFDHNLILADELLGAVTISGLAIRSLVQV